jgi:hypothetical protein
MRLDRRKRLRHHVNSKMLQEPPGGIVLFRQRETQFECLAAVSAGWFANLLEARARIGARKEEYNEERLHSSLEYLGRKNLRHESLGAKSKIISSGDLSLMILCAELGGSTDRSEPVSRILQPMLKANNFF